MTVQVLYEDNHLIAVYKPAGMLVQGDKTKDVCLMDVVKEYLKHTYNKPGNTFLGLIHRLDRPVAGVVLFAKTSKGASRMSEQFREHTIQKIYHAMVEYPAHIQPKTQATLLNYLKKNSKINKVHVYNTPEPGALRAELEYELLRIDGHRALLKVTLKTGRPHQIRAQLAHCQMPIVGDKKYGAKTTVGKNNNAIALIASELTIRLATKEERKTIRVDIPKEWNI